MTGVDWVESCIEVKRVAGRRGVDEVAARFKGVLGSALGMTGVNFAVSGRGWGVDG